MRFVFSAAQSDAVVVGVLGKSQDQVGRTFPLAIYTTLSIGYAARAFHAIPLVLAKHPDTRFVVDHAPCAVLLVWPGEAPTVDSIPPPPAHPPAHPQGPPGRPG